MLSDIRFFWYSKILKTQVRLQAMHDCKQPVKRFHYTRHIMAQRNFSSLAKSMNINFLGGHKQKRRRGKDVGDNIIMKADLEKSRVVLIKFLCLLVLWQIYKMQRHLLLARRTSHRHVRRQNNYLQWQTWKWRVKTLKGCWIFNLFGYFISHHPFKGAPPPPPPPTPPSQTHILLQTQYKRTSSPLPATSWTR